MTWGIYIYMKEERGKRERGMEREGERKREEEGGEGRENEVSDQDLASHTPLHIHTQTYTWR